MPTCSQCGFLGSSQEPTKLATIMDAKCRQSLYNGKNRIEYIFRTVKLHIIGQFINIKRPINLKILKCNEMAHRFQLQYEMDRYE